MSVAPYPDPVMAPVMIVVSLLITLAVWGLVFRRMGSYQKRRWLFILLSAILFIVLSIVLVQLFAILPGSGPLIGPDGEIIA